MGLGKSTRGPARALATWESVQPLIELYNLHGCDPDAVKSYLSKFAPHLFEEGAKFESLEAYAEPPQTRVYGTLEHFSQSEGRDWAESEYFDKFCKLRASLCDLLDRYVNNTLRVIDLVELQNLMRQFAPTFALRDRETGRIYSMAALWSKRFDAQRYELIWHGLLVESGWVLREYKLALGELVARLIFGLYEIIANAMPVKRCANRGCKNLFIPKPGAPGPTKATTPKYCPSCRSKRKRV